MTDRDPDPVDHRRVYAGQADAYERLVSAEDADRRLLPALSAHVDLEGAQVLELGAGTGRVTELLLAAGARVVGCEPAAAMLDVARRRLARFPADRCELHLATAQELVAPVARFDLAIAGWVLGHFVEWYPASWRDEIGGVLDKMEGALRPSGMVAIIETLGTGETEPAPPTPGLADYYAWLEQERGFHRTALRTDYAFPDVETAASVSGAFFGDRFAERVRAESWKRIPECTGLWSRRQAS